MLASADPRLETLARRGDSGVLRGGLRGIEKESLRVTPTGEIARTPHPAALGAALTHRWITTDFSEALPELITPPYPTNWEALNFLCELHRFVYAHIGDELLWATSMPCRIRGDESVPIARYGDSNVGRMKHVYRRGLANRYGRVMQAIAGVHFNYSVPEAFWPVYGELVGRVDDLRRLRDDAYLGLLRNYRRYGWILLYLFGASPAICRSFLCGRSTNLESLGEGTVFGRHATTLRLSDLGYRNESQAGLSIGMNDLGEYVEDLDAAILTPYPPYEALGTAADGEWRQLSTSILQIENEYYGQIRPKQVAHSGERPTHALERRGIAYVEVRALDVSPMDPAGISQNEMRFIEALLLYCLLTDSPPMDHEEARVCDNVSALVAARGREPGLEIPIGGRTALLTHWARAITDRLEPVCAVLDEGQPDDSYRSALDAQREKIEDPARTPSARILETLARRRESFFDFALRLSRRHKAYFDSLPPPQPEVGERLAAEARASHERQDEIERAPQPPFEEYLRRYYAGG
jgi:glutamate--cysteine ligase